MANTANTGGGRRRRGSTAGHVAAIFFKVIGTLVLVGIVTGMIMASFAAVYIKNVIMPQTHMEITDYSMNMNLTSTIYYTDKSTGRRVESQTLHGEENRVWVPYDQIPENLVNATIAIEDKRFREHNGVDWKRTAYGVFAMFTGKKIQGGSTITQQLIKNLTEYDDVTVKRKILEIFTALDFDSNYSKDTTMEWYLNYIYLGEGCNGVSTAARNYFGKDLDQLTLAECASLISITNNPSMYNPHRNPENNLERRNLVLSEMKDQGYITQEEYDKAVAEPLNTVRSVDEEAPTQVFSWYDEQVITDVINDLVAQKGMSTTAATILVYSGGLEIDSCMDPAIQAIVEEIYSNQENMILPSKSGQNLQSAIVIVDPEGNIVALAGALGEKERNRVWNYASRSQRQPGSSIKPLSVYAPALEMGLVTPNSVFDDTPVQELNGSAWPRNSYLSYKGRMNVYDAVRMSSNAVAVRVFQTIGAEGSFQFMEDHFHIGLVESRDGSSDLGPAQLALGGLTDGVSPRDMATAYSVFPRNGKYVASRTYTQVRDSNGKVLLDTTEQKPEFVLKESTVWYMNYMLQSVVNGGSGSTGREARFDGMTIAGKTGSTNSNNDRWFVGYTPYYTAAVWCGYDTPERINAGNSNPSAVLWNKVMSRVHEGLEKKEFPKPEGVIQFQYCMDSGLRASEDCALDPRGSRVATGYYFSEDIPAGYCDVHKKVEVCTASPILNADGAAIPGLFHQVGEFCPREAIEGTDIVSTVQEIALLDIDREGVSGSKPAADSNFLLSFWEAQGVCDVHTSPVEVPPAEYDPSTFRIEDPSTWPPVEYNPLFDPYNPDTWPVVTPTPSPEPTDPNIPTDPTLPPSAEPTPYPTPEPTPSVPPTAAPEPTPTPEPSPTPGGGDVILPPEAEGA